MKKIIEFIKAFILATIAFVKAHPTISRALHTFYQAFIGVVIAGIMPIGQELLKGNLTAAKIGLFGLLSTAIAAGISALKTFLLSLKNKNIAK